jgi:ABC-type enterochelin transport system ATPase subunit
MSPRYPEGSIWRKWDLHAHTPIDHEWLSRPDLGTEAARESFAREYVGAAIGKNLAVIAITDHNFCDRVENLLLPYIRREAARNNLVVLPGFEVTVSDCGGTHLLVIFSEDTQLSTIDDVVKQLFPPGRERFRDRMVLPSLASAEDLYQILKNSHLRNLILFAHTDRENGALHHRGSALRASLWQSPFINIAQVSKNPNEFTGFLAAVTTGVDENYKREMTYVLASDCRQLHQDGSAEGRFCLGERFTWIKADPTFEGLYQIVYEPLARVCIQDHEPETKPDYLIISSARFLDDQRRFQSEAIPFNQALTCIVGGKSTGKSILLSMVAQAIDKEESEQKIKVSAINIYDFLELDLDITWRDGTTDRLSAPSGQHKIAFIPQMYIHKLVEGENRPQLSDSILTFLRQNDEFNSKYSSFCEKIKTQNNEIELKIVALLGLRSAFIEANTRLRDIGNQAAVESEQTKVSTRQEALRSSSGFTPEETERYKALVKDISDISDRIAYLKRRGIAFRELRDLAEGATKGLQTEIASLTDDPLARHELSIEDCKKVTAAVSRLSLAIQSSLKIFMQEVDDILSPDAKVIQSKEQQLSAANSSLKPFLAKISNQKELDELARKTVALRKTLESIRSHNKDLAEIRTQYKEKRQELRELLEAHLSLKQGLSSLYAEPAYVDIGDGISIVAKMQFDNQRFLDSFVEQFDLRAPLERLGASFKDTELVWSEESHIGIILKMLDTLLTASQSELRLRSGRTREDVIKALAADYLKHTFSVQQNSEDILLMSPGKQGLILLELFLHLSSATYPILIDQPEDNLDNRTIYTHLARFLRKKKVQRQIIVVTHNPNLVVGTDAEEVIVANQDGQGHGENEAFRFEYISGSLECSFPCQDASSVLKTQGIREHVCQVLEGGADAFRQRERKYNLARQSSAR